MAEHINKVPATHLHDTGSKSHVSTSQASVSSTVVFGKINEEAHN